MGDDGLVHVVVVMGHASYETICGTAVIISSGYYHQPTCVRCVSNIVLCMCGSPGELQFCDYDDDIHACETVCRCCRSCARKCCEDT